MNILSMISGIFKPAADLVDNLHTSTEEKHQLRNELARIEADLVTKVMEVEAKALEGAQQVAIAETQSESWFTRTYRPAIITGMFLLMAASVFGLTKVQLPESFYMIFGASFGIIGGGRTAEKIFKIKQG